ncbi:hypothetical protein CSPX01_02780 [Colletotrichum filicis]|nr:hypothetical protein CSPX01_02780 [Colletotrichum filicis]
MWNDGKKDASLLSTRRTPSKKRYGSTEGPSTGAFAWPQRFFKRQLIAEDWENTPWIKSIQSYAEEDSEYEDVAFFLRNEEDWFPDKLRVEPLADLTRGATIKKLLNHDENIPDVRNALLIDGNIDDTGHPQFRKPPTGLSAKDLMTELMKKRYNDGSSEDCSTYKAEDAIEAERRLM